MGTINVFISYSHDSDEHRERVLALSERLRQDGIHTILDQYVNGSPEQGWPRWMLDQLDAATYVLVICTATYYRRFRGHEEPGKGKGVDWEGALITQELYDARSRTLKFVPVFLSAPVADCIPEPLRSINYYALTSENAYQNLYDFLLGQAGVEPGTIGELKQKPRATGQPLTFGKDEGGTENKSSLAQTGSDNIALQHVTNSNVTINYNAPILSNPTGSASETLTCKVDIDRITRYAPAELIGREDEMAILNDAWAKVQSQEKPRPHILTFVAFGGEGKTSLVAKWAVDEMLAKGWPGCDAAFAWSFYHQGTDEKTADSSDLFLKAALDFFGDDEDRAFAASNAGAYEKGERLARVVARRRCLLILDGLEPLQYAPSAPTPGELKDQGVAALLKKLAAENRGLCVVTTWYALPDLRAFLKQTVREEPLLRLSRAAGVKLLTDLGVRRESGSQAQFEALVEDVKGHALTLTLLGGYLRDAHGGDIRRRDLVTLAEADAESDHPNHAAHVMDAYVKWFESGGQTADEILRGRRALALLRLMGLFDRPATADCLNALWQAPAIPGLTEPLLGLTEAQRNLALKRLEDAKLLTVNRAAGSGGLITIDAHPLLREYFARRVRDEQPEAWRAAHRRLYEYLCATTEDKDTPTLDDLLPLYQAVAHGCQAGLFEEALAKVYHDRILRGTSSAGFYSWKKLGAVGSDLGAVYYFFQTPWSCVLPLFSKAHQGWLLNEAALRLRAMGRLTDSLEPMRAGMAMAVKQENWEYAAISASNLSEVELTLGQVARAESDADQSVCYADHGSDTWLRITKRTTHADTLHQTGRRAEAFTRYREAEQIQAAIHTYPRLYSLWGFRYCDLLLAQAERAAGKRNVELGRINDELIADCRIVTERATQALNIVLSGSLNLLDIALNHLTLGRAALYEAILTNSAFHSSHSAIEQAVSGLRRAGEQIWLTAGLLTRAWLGVLTGARIGPDSAQADLDEAWEIAVRGPMRLHMADIHLYRARLFFREPSYPWQSPEHDLAEAERLINECGYHRRDEELADAKRAILEKA